MHLLPMTPAATRTPTDDTYERIQLEHRLARIADRLRVLQEERAQAIRADREAWPRKRRWHERRRP